ncbi:MAG: NAD(P)H-dependent oxidoreductase [Corynebacterium sp.]|nr:NAD(P)H-dependent oxidoreductase [Corynebacterium sp.]
MTDKTPNTVVLVFHPQLESGSRINRVLANAAANAGAVVRDIYQLYPDFQIDVLAEQKILAAADRIVFQFPTYWYSAPALLRQWEDEVLEYGWAYGSNGTALHGKDLLVVTSWGAPSESYTETGRTHFTTNELLRPHQATATMVGMRYLEPLTITGAMGLSDANLADFAASYQEKLRAPELPAFAVRGQ